MSNLILPKDHPHKDGKICNKCNVFKLADQYALEREQRTKRIVMRAQCRPCREHDKYKAFIKRTYGITYEEYLEILNKQNDCCAICKSILPNSKATKLFVDHCHTTGKVRGLLCSKCNHGLGHFNDNIDLLSEAIKYLISSRK